MTASGTISMTPPTKHQDNDDDNDDDDDDDCRGEKNYLG